MYLYKRFQKIRNLKQISRQYLAKGIVSYSHLSNFESGRYQLSDDILESLANKLEVPIGYLLQYDSIDHKLEKTLYELKKLIKSGNFQEAEILLDNIETSYPFINSIYQEVCFFLLKSYLYMKIQKVTEAAYCFNNDIACLLDNRDIHAFPYYFAEIYYYITAMIHYYNKDYTKSYDNFIIQLSFTSNSLSTADTYYNIAIVFYKLGNLFNSISFAKQALDIYLFELRWTDICSTYNLIGTLYWEDKDLISAKNHLLKALSIAEKFDMIKNKERIYHNLGLLYKSYNKYDQSIEYLNKSLELKKLSNNALNITYFSIIDIYIKENMIEKSEAIINEAKKLCTNEIDTYAFKKFEASINLHKGNNSLYETYMEEAFRYFHKVSNWKQTADICKELSAYYEKLNRYKKACKFYKISLELKNYYEEENYEKK